ncbi:hypothetical protein [Streptomyces sp. NBC_01187]|uniref:hypothetical protein n=1 Tax=Streptomyces sp. NBC_01187 TaxID=2903766 RepID=UPI00386B5315|nr:hypothetical protein OG220_17730 [Streptomyces sp. NBC_01187]
MTAENNGTGATPGGGDASQPDTGADDDPFAYLYRQEGGTQQASPGQQPGVPRRSYNQVRAVGERQYGYGYPQQQQQRGGYGYPQQRSGAGGYGYPQQAPPPPPQQPSPHYAAPETMAGGRAASRQQAGAGGYGSGSGRRSRTGLMVGAIAVVAAVVIGIGAAIVFNDGNRAQGNESDDAGTSEQAGGEPEKGEKNDSKKDKPAPSGLPKEDAASLTLAGGTQAAKDIPGAKGRGGTYVAGLNNQGASATWDMKNVPSPGQYRLYVRFGVPGKDADATLTVNGKAEGRPLQMKNFSGTKEGDWAKGWQTTWSIVQLKKGQNSVKISCESGNQCDANLDQVWLKRN